jgi:hypothetical protein
MTALRRIFVICIAILEIMAIHIPFVCAQQSTRQMSLQWPKGEHACTGFWVFHPHARVHSECRDPSHGYERPIFKQEVVAWEQITGADEDPPTPSCRFSNQGAFANSPQMRSLARVRAQWSNVDMNTLRGEFIQRGPRHGGRVRCFVTVWNTPPFALRVSDACPIVTDKSRIVGTKFLAYDGEWQITDQRQFVRCTTCDQFSVTTAAQREAKLQCEIRTLECPVELLRLGPSRDPQSCRQQINWSSEIQRNEEQAFRAVRSLVYDTYYLQALRDQYTFTPQETERVDRLIKQSKEKLPLVIQIFQVAIGPNSSRRTELADFLSIVALLH